MEDLAGRRVLITGGGRGIGAALVRRFVAEGATVAFSYRRDRESADRLAAEVSREGHPVAAFQADAADRSESHRLVDDAVAAIGGLDVLISNAGVEHFGPLADITEDDVARVFGINVAGQLWAAQAAAEHLTEGGRIVLTSSVSARMAVFHHTLYAASKAAVSAMVRNLAPELGRRGITINAVAPGGTQTDMANENAARYTHPDLVGADLSVHALFSQFCALGRLAEPEEVASAVVFLAGAESSYINGSTLQVDGGLM